MTAVAKKALPKSCLRCRDGEKRLSEDSDYAVYAPFFSFEGKLKRWKPRQS